MVKLIRAADVPAEVLRPTVWTQWRVVAYTGKNGDRKLGETFVKADSAKDAEALGKRALRLIGVRGRYVVNATRTIRGAITRSLVLSDIVLKRS